MKSLLETIDGLEQLIRQLHKLESKMRSGQIIDAWRETNRIIAKLEAEKTRLIEEDKSSERQS